MIRVEVTSEADAARMTAAFTSLPALRGVDYEVFLVSGFGPGGGGAVRRAWRKDGLRGGTGSSNTVHVNGSADAVQGGGGGTGSVNVVRPN